MTIHDAIAAKAEPLGGILRCAEGCQRERPLGGIAGKLAHGWPKCCGYTMRWVTRRQLDEEAGTNRPEGQS